MAEFLPSDDVSEWPIAPGYSARNPSIRVGVCDGRSVFVLYDNRNGGAHVVLGFDAPNRGSIPVARQNLQQLYAERAQTEG